jgi:hypothetical protein
VKLTSVRSFLDLPAPRGSRPSHLGSRVQQQPTRESPSSAVPVHRSTRRQNVEVAPAFRRTQSGQSRPLVVFLELSRAIGREQTRQRELPSKFRSRKRDRMELTTWWPRTAAQAGLVPRRDYPSVRSAYRTPTRRSGSTSRLRRLSPFSSPVLPAAG